VKLNEKIYDGNNALVPRNPSEMNAYAFQIYSLNRIVTLYASFA